MRDSIACLIRLLAVALLVAVNGTACFAECVAVGAIRWDAWYGGGKVSAGLTVEQVLSKGEFAARSPFCSRRIEGGELEMRCATPAAIDQEIDYAAIAGIDYWAFLAYPERDNMSLALKRYLESPKKTKVNFSIIMTPASLTLPAGSQNANMERFAGYLQLPNYQKVMNIRPLVFFFPAGDVLANPDKVLWLKKTFVDFRNLVRSKGIANPYIVLMDFSPKQNQQITKTLGIDALSTYATHGSSRGGLYPTLAADARDFWQRSQSTGLAVVPTAMAGWDPRPRASATIMGNNKTADVAYYHQPTAQELASHVEDGIRWVSANRKAAEANTMLIYAWNENDEGGWLVPTIGEGSSRVAELGRILRKNCPTRP